MEDINNMNLSYTDKIKKILESSKYNLTTLNQELNNLNGTNTTVQNLSARLKKETLRYDEVEQILNILNYKLEWKYMPMRVQTKIGDKYISSYPPTPKPLNHTIDIDAISTINHDISNAYKKMITLYEKDTHNNELLNTLNDILNELVSFKIKLIGMLNAHNKMPDIFGVDDTFDYYYNAQKSIIKLVEKLYRIEIGDQNFEDMIRYQED